MSMEKVPHLYKSVHTTRTGLTTEQVSASPIPLCSRTSPRTSMAQDKVRIRVGEQIFFTSRGTIANGGRNTLLAAMTDSLWQRPGVVGDSLSEASEHFIDRNPAYFSVLLDLLRTGQLHIPVGMSETALMQEALYYGLLDQVRAAQHGPLDGDNLARIALVRGCGGGPGRAVEQPWSAIRANADGGCCIARKAVVRTYDWTLQQQAVLDLDYAPVSDVDYIGTHRIVVSSYDAGDGAMACFDASSGEVVHRYQVEPRHDDGRLWTFNGDCIATSDGRHVYATCRCQNEEGALGTWDQTTGQEVQLVSFADLRLPIEPTWCRLHWLPESNLLMVVKMGVVHGRTSCISLLDPRANRMAWPQGGPLLLKNLPVNAVAMEDSSTIAVMNDSDRLGFIDIRGETDRVVWGQPGDVFATSPPTLSCLDMHQPALVYWGSQLFASRDESVHVLSSRNWKTGQCTETAMVRRAQGGEISDVAVGGDRLFVLHKETDSFEVWETPGSRAPKIKTPCNQVRQFV